MALVRLYPGRPAFVGPVCVSTHDTWHLKRRAALRGRLLKTPQSNKKFVRRATAALQAFDGREKAWYAELGLTPPRLGMASWEHYKAGRKKRPPKPPSMTRAAIEMRRWRAKRRGG